MNPSTSEAGRQSNGLCQIGAGGLVFVDHPERLIHCRAGEGKLAPLIPSLALHAGCGSTGDAASAAASVDPAGGDQLGIHGRNASASDGLQSAESDRIPGVALVRRYALQGAARELLPNERSLQGCIRWLHAGTVQLFHIPRHQVGAFGGLQHCGSVWQCPVCSAKVSERRRQELGRGVEGWQGSGGVVLLVTYTLRHHLADDLRVTLQGLLRARKRMLSGRWAKSFTERFGVVGRIRALEVTHGQNGWHPHVHELVFLRGDVDREAFLQELRAQWSAQVLKAGLKAVNSHGVDVRFADLSVADYVSKFGRERTWGPEHELTKSAAKLGKQGSRGPIGLLSDYLAGDAHAGMLWREYAQVFKGSRQLVWSDGLRQLLGLGQEQSDVEIAAELREDAALMDELSREEWRVVLGNDARAELLQVLGSGSLTEVRKFLSALGILRTEPGEGLLTNLTVGGSGLLDRDRGLAVPAILDEFDVRAVGAGEACKVDGADPELYFGRVDVVRVAFRHTVGRFRGAQSSFSFDGISNDCSNKQAVAGSYHEALGDCKSGGQSAETLGQGRDDLAGLQAVEAGGFAVTSSGCVSDDVAQVPGGVNDGLPFGCGGVGGAAFSGSVGCLPGGVVGVDPRSAHSVKLRYETALRYVLSDHGGNGPLAALEAQEGLGKG